MKNKKRAALAAVLCSVLLGAVGFFGVRTRYEKPQKSDAQESPPTTVYDAYPDETAPPATEPASVPAPPEPETYVLEQQSAPAAEESSPESETVDATMPRPEYFDIPLSRDISLDYSSAEPVFNPTMGDWRTHNGIDFAGVVGDPIKSCASGFVSEVYDDPLYGTVMVIDHGGGVVAKYCGLGKGSTVPVGTEVKMDDTIGYLSFVPCESESGAHLHFEITENGETVDPLSILIMP